MKRIAAFLMCILMLASTQISVLASVDTEAYEEMLDSFTQSDGKEKVGSLSKVKAQLSSTQADFSDLIEDMVKDDDVDSFYSEIVIDKEEKTITKGSNESENLSEYSSASCNNISAAKLPAEALFDALEIENEIDSEKQEIVVETENFQETIQGYAEEEDSEVYVDNVELSKKLAINVSESGNKIVVSSPFQTKRLLVKTKDNAVLKSRVKASKAISDGEGLYILQFETEVETQKAYASFKNDSSIESVEIDTVYTVSALSER